MHAAGFQTSDDSSGHDGPSQLGTSQLKYHSNALIMSPSNGSQSLKEHLCRWLQLWLRRPSIRS